MIHNRRPYSRLRSAVPGVVACGKPLRVYVKKAMSQIDELG
jgi:hypothetical protein